MRGWLLVLFALSVASLKAENELTFLEKTQWAQIEANMGKIHWDGSLKYQFSLGESEPLALLGLRLSIAHEIDCDENGAARSVWRVSGLQTSLAPSGHKALRWKSPLGPTIDFEKEQIGAAFSYAGAARWLIRKTAARGAGETGYEIRSSEGISWHYESGRLVVIEHPVLGQLRVSTEGGWITRIEPSDAPAGAAPLLEASYSENGEEGRTGGLRTLRIGEQTTQTFTWENGDLVAWQSEAGVRRSWAYTDGLLSRISETEQPAREIRWDPNKGFGRGDSRWALPVHVAAVDTERYGYTLTRQGFVLTREKRASGLGGSSGGSSSDTSDLKVTNYFNPLRYRLEQRVNGEVFIVTFRQHSPGRGAVEQIENAAGEILEAYRYDAEGHLVELRTRGEPPLRFGYDGLGRLIEMKGAATQ